MLWQPTLNLQLLGLSTRNQLILKKFKCWKHPEVNFYFNFIFYIRIKRMEFCELQPPFQSLDLTIPRNIFSTIVVGAINFYVINCLLCFVSRPIQYEINSFLLVLIAGICKIACQNHKTDGAYSWCSKRQTLIVLLPPIGLRVYLSQAHYNWLLCLRLGGQPRWSQRSDQDRPFNKNVERTIPISTDMLSAAHWHNMFVIRQLKRD